ncbi:putative trypsin-like serine protease [Actinoplanes missouriensis 431]|uniref:Putative trypsin-like serine protease n=1 Tax=Actinoplanes missouriensis (strain ATCC 14538 / DSM 43046 / CBS 188.64 / JCM 3121 / NBRC 102363 / NCIMB 12654 / NRRL B-3342 / UNCC 431) TaxID=512565 RepID=I0H5B7_ACTM4|nr:S1 family peptidase [Actinoplanes missouriensis]BAL88204.1 putative trypsin-like serine protease [Actinoplanes missouriensis 431]
MRNTRARGRAALLTAALLGASLVPAGAAQAVGGGAPATDAGLAFSVKITFGDLVRSCTGTLVNRWWVLTAASCFDDGSGVAAGEPKRATTATIGRLDLTGTGGQVRTVRAIVPHPDRDLALARLTDEVTGITPVTISPTAPATGETLVAAGYGRTADTWYPTKLHTGDFTVTATGAGTLDITAADKATICRGDAGGPLLRRTGSTYQLVGVHYRSYQGGCLGETATRRDAAETRVDDLASWITTTAKLPNSLQVGVTDTRVAVRQGDYGTRVKDGGLSASWTNLLADAKDIVVVGDRIGVLTHSGAAYVKDGATSVPFVKVFDGVKKLVLSPNRVGVLTAAGGLAKVKEGGLSTSWVDEYTGVHDLAITDTRIAITAGLNRVMMIKEGGLSADWHEPLIQVGTGLEGVTLSGNRVGRYGLNRSARVYEGPIDWSGRTYDLVSSGAKELVLKDDRVGLLTTDGVAKVKEGALGNEFVTQYTGVRDLDVSGSRVGVVTIDGSAIAKHGGLSALWTPVW